MRLATTLLAVPALSMFLAGCDAAGGSKTIASMLPHQDHSSRRGGMVLMDGDVHFEVVVDFDGNYAVAFSGAYREPLPATAVEEATLTVMRAGSPEEVLVLKAGDGGLWSASGGKIDAKEVDVRVSFRKAGSTTPYSIDLTIDAPQPLAHSHPH